MKNQVENNKLIAEFMDVVFHDDENQYYDHEGYYIGLNLKYNTSWNWLMPVTTKAFNKACEMSLNDVVGADDHRQKIMDAHTMFDKKETYKALVEFIKWYNENK